MFTIFFMHPFQEMKLTSCFCNVVNLLMLLLINYSKHQTHDFCHIYCIEMAFNKLFPSHSSDLWRNSAACRGDS